MRATTERLSRLTRKRAIALTEKRTVAALEVIDRIGSAFDGMETQRAAYEQRRRAAGKDWWRDFETIRELVAMLRASFQARKIAWAHYVFAVSHAVEGVHEGLFMDGKYDSELSTLSQQCEMLEERGDQASIDVWGVLNAEYERRLEAKLDELWSTLGADDVGALRRRDAALHEKIRERGRRFIHHRSDALAALRDLTDECYAEAVAAAKGRCYRAAVTLLGASIEGLLLFRCLRAPTRAAAVAKKLPRRLRTRATEEIVSWPFEVLIEVCARANWLPVLLTPTLAYDAQAYAHALRGMRNWIHPGREARERPWQGVFEQDYELAHALYVLVDTSVRTRRRRAGA